MARDQVTLAGREIRIAESNLVSAQRIEQVTVEALKALDDAEATLTAETSAVSLDSDAMMIIDTIGGQQGEKSDEKAVT